MPRSWSPKRERQYEHIKEEVKERGRSEDTAERIAAATVNRTRTAKGETKRPQPKTKRVAAKRAMSATSRRNGRKAASGRKTTARRKTTTKRRAA